jgi:hypothetical protein
VIMDRCHQNRAKNTLEPEWEARFEARSYGFRPGRSCQDAIEAIYDTCKGRGATRVWTLDADLAAAFDKLDHSHLMSAIGSFPGRGMIRAWHSGIASAVNNAVSRLGQMIAVAALPLAAGLSGAAFENPARMAAGFLLAWTTISENALNRPAAGAEPVAKDLPPSLQRHCAVAGTPLAASLIPRPSSHPPPAKES